MNFFEYFEDHSIRCLVGRLTKNFYDDFISARQRDLYQLIDRYYSNQLETADLGKLEFQRTLILNQRFEKWNYPIFCFNLQKSNHTRPFFFVTKGLNKVYANFLARRSISDIPVIVTNYGKICQDIIIEKDIYTQSELEDFIGSNNVFIKQNYYSVDNVQYPIIDHIRDDKTLLGETDSTKHWLNFLKSLCTDKKIPISIIDTHNSDISNTNNFFQIVNLLEYKNKVPTVVERTTHIREYKNLLRNDNETIGSFILVTNRKIKLDLFDIIWFLQNHASDYVSEDRSYSILGPGVFRADSVLPGSEL